MSVLSDICNRKREHVEAQKAKTPLDALKSRIDDQEKPRGFRQALKNSSAPAIIAEVKKASPSKGIIRENFDPAEIGKIYEAHGAACVSVLTDEPYFQGSDAYFTAVKNVSTIPLLRKDFMVDPYQIFESRALGADCILLIMAALRDDEAITLFDLSKSLGMDVLIEVHDQEELERAYALKPDLLGINNRNLNTLEVDVQTSFDLFKHMPQDTLKVTESGISDAQTIQKLQNHGFDAFLVGESLMSEADIGHALQTLRRTNQQNI